MSLVVLPLSFVDISVGVDQPTSAVGSVLEPIALIERKIFPHLFTATVPHAITELAYVAQSVAHIDGALRYKILMLFIIKFEGPQPSSYLFGFVIVKVFGLKVVVYVSIKHKCILSFSLDSSTCFALVPHSNFFSNYNKAKYSSFLGSCIQNHIQKFIGSIRINEIVRSYFLKLVYQLSSYVIQLLITMNQRSISAKQKHKSHIQNDISFDKKVTKAIQHKKTLIAKMATQKSESQQLMSYRLSCFWKAKNSPRHSQTLTPTKALKVVYLSQQMMSDYLQNNHIFEGVCANHPQKKAAFEQKQERTNLYCHECAIKMVKSNTKVMAISPQTLMLKAILEKQIDKLVQEQTKVKEIIDHYYQELRDKLSKFYTSYQQQKAQDPESVIFGEFQDSKTLMTKLKESLGNVQQVKFQFKVGEEKENCNKDTNRVMHKDYERKEANDSFDLVVETNRSLETKPYRLSGKNIRSRQNSNYLKKEPLQQYKMLKLR